MTKAPRIRMIGPRITTLSSSLKVAGADSYQARPGARRRGYDRKWDAAAAVFRLQHPWCLGCQALGKQVAVEVVDHVSPHRGDQSKFWNASMWQPACRWHHNVVKKRLEALVDQGLIGVGELWLNSKTAADISRRELGRRT